MVSFGKASGGIEYLGYLVGTYQEIEAVAKIRFGPRMVS